MIALIIQFVFSLVMVQDAWTRRVPFYWYVIILLPFGELVYFFRMSLRDPAFRRFRSGDLKHAKNLEKARRDFSITPTLHHRRQLARALLARQETDEALDLLQPFAHQFADDLEFQILLGKALVNQHEYLQAIEILEPLVAKSPKAMEFEAWLFLVAAQAGAGNKDRALALMRDLQETFPRMKHQLTLAAYLTKYGAVSDAQSLIKQALQAYENFPAFLHWEHSFWAQEARRMQRQKIPLPKP